MPAARKLAYFAAATGPLRSVSSSANRYHPECGGQRHQGESREAELIGTHHERDRPLRECFRHTQPDEQQQRELDEHVPRHVRFQPAPQEQDRRSDRHRREQRLTTAEGQRDWLCVRAHASAASGSLKSKIRIKPSVGEHDMDGRVVRETAEASSSTTTAVSRSTRARSARLSGTATIHRSGCA